MRQADVTTHKFAVVLNKKVDIGYTLNAACHMIAGLVAKATDAQRQEMAFLTFIDGSGSEHSLISSLSIVVLRADNSNHLRRLREEAAAASLLSVDFTSSMVGETYRQQLERTKATNQSDLEYWGVAVFGPNDDVGGITKRFSLFRAASTETTAAP